MNEYLCTLAFYLPFATLWLFLRKRGLPRPKEGPSCEVEALPVTLGGLDHVKALFCWAFNFMKTFAVRPGLYYLGEREGDAPLLVTCNYYLTVFLLARRIGNRSARLLVLDTDGINVWCSAGKGKFSAQAVIEALEKYRLLERGLKPEVILPKFSLSGVKLQALREKGIKPVIGPLYARDLPAYLDGGKWENRYEDVVCFGLQSRLFTALPTALQFLYYSLGLYLLGFGYVPLCVIPVVSLLAFLYPLLFPWLPGRLFAEKGLSLALLATVTTSFLVSTYQTFIIWGLFIFATQLFISLSYTGNSAVSNMTGVRRETARFLPVIGVLYLLIIPVFFLL